MISDDDEAKISKSLIKADIEIKKKNSLNLKKKKKKKKNPQKTIQKADNKTKLKTLNYAFENLETVDYNNDTTLGDLQTIAYNNDTSITDLVPITKLETITEENDEEDGLQVKKTVDSINRSDDDEVKFKKKSPLHPRDRLKRLSENYLIRN